MTHGGNVWQGDGPEAWLDYSANLRPEGLPGWVREALLAGAERARFYPDPEMKRARRGLAAYAGVEPERILPTPGGAAAIDLALGLDEGAVLVGEVTFFYFLLRAKAHNRPVKSNLCAPAAGDTLVFCNPNNPTGKVLGREQILKRAQYAQSLGARTLVDEAFIDFCPEYSLRKSASDSLIVTGSLTKILGAPGIRLGYVCASPELISAMEKKLVPWSLSSGAVEVAARLPDELKELKQYARINARRRERFAGALTRLGVQVTPSHANFLLCDFGRDMQKVIDRLKARGILVRSCASFGLADSFLRLSVKTDEENRYFIEELKKCLEY